MYPPHRLAEKVRHREDGQLGEIVFRCQGDGIRDNDLLKQPPREALNGGRAEDCVGAACVDLPGPFCME